MKGVRKMSNKQVAELFAYTNREGHTKNLFIKGKAIYSYGYHFRIAQKIEQNKALFTTRGYSQTTSCHKGLVKRALTEAGYNISEVEL